MPEPKDLPRDAIWVERTSYTKPATRDTTAPDRVTTRRDDIVEVLGKQQADLVRKLDRVWAVVLVLAALVAFSLLGHCINGTHYARAHGGIPPVILPILPDGGVCEHPPEDPGPHPTPDEVWALLEAPATEAERRMVETVMDGCPRAPRRMIDPWRVLALLRYEVMLGVPESARYLLPATACIESALQPARGLFGDAGRALGPMQLHWPWAAFCMDRRTHRSPADWRAVMGHGDFRGSLAFSARCWVAATERNLARAAPCGDAAYVVAEAIVSRAPHPLNCNARTAHARLAEVWRAL